MRLELLTSNSATSLPHTGLAFRTVRMNVGTKITVNGAPTNNSNLLCSIGIDEAPCIGVGGILCRILHANDCCSRCHLKINCILKKQTNTAQRDDVVPFNNTLGPWGQHYKLIILYLQIKAQLARSHSGRQWPVHATVGLRWWSCHLLQPQLWQRPVLCAHRGTVTNSKNQ